MTGAFFVILVAGLFITNWVIAADHITLITVIAALLLFRYYSTVKLANLLEFSNTQKAADTASKNAGAVTKKVQEIVPKFEKMVTMADQHRNQISSLLDVAGIKGVAPLKDTTNQYASETQGIVSELEVDLQELETLYNVLQNTRTELETERKIIASMINRI
jgi:hypothetical protein